MKEFIAQLKKGQALSPEAMDMIMRAIMTGGAPQEDIAEFLLALQAKGPTVDEITGAARLLQQFAQRVKTRHAVVLDTCGTGGDKKHTFNISTISAIVVAAAGVIVAKHGNRSVSSRCGSADLLEALGVNITLEQECLERCLDEVGIAFLFAQKLHPAMKNVAPVRKALGVETLFNILGPLINPAQATHQLMGVYSRDLVAPIAGVLKNLGLKKALVVHGSDGLDEVTTTGKTFVCEWNGQDIISYDINPEDVGIPLARESDLKGGDRAQNAVIAREIFAGTKGAKRDIVVLNAGCAIYAAEQARSIADGIQRAIEVIDTGEAQRKLEALVNFTQRAGCS